MKKFKLIYIISDVDKAVSFEWIALRLKEKYDLMFVLIGNKNSALKTWLTREQIRVQEISNSNPMIKQWIKLFVILYKENPRIIHTHLWMANLLGLSTAWTLRIKKRIFTRHHATIHYDEHPSGRKWERLCNYLATDIIAISKNTQSILIDRDKASPGKVKLIPHGFDLNYFTNVSSERINILKVKYDIERHGSPVIGIIARYMKWKGVQYVIEAFKSILKKHPSALLILANAQGNYADQIKKQLASLPPDSFKEILFEEDLAALYKVFDIYVHVPVDAQSEAFGQTYVEALASGIPSVFTLSGIAQEFISHKINAWVVDFRNSEQIAEGILEIHSNAELRDHLKIYGSSSIKGFTIDNHMVALEELYNNG